MRVFVVAIMALLVGVLAGCDKNDRGKLEQLAAALAPTLIGEAEDFLNSGQCRDALGTEGHDLALLAANYLTPRLLNKASELAAGETPISLGHDWISREYPTVGAMIYRVNDYGIAEGLWPRLEVWLRDKGYLGETTLYQAVTGEYISFRVEFSDDDLEELAELAPRAIIEEYYAVKYAAKAAEPPVDTSEGIEVGGE